MKILVLPRKGVPAAACSVVYRVGSVYERPGYTGMAHFLEHMMFKGTKKIGVKDLAADRTFREKLDHLVGAIIRLEDGPDTPEARERLIDLKVKRETLFREQKENIEVNHIFRIYRDAGAGFTNAFTSNDMTAFICMLPPEKLELFFWVEADRMQNLIFRQFHAEKDVVREERRMSENRPGALFREEMQRALFGAHPYAHPVLGYHEDVRLLTRHDLRAFWNKYYTPDNAFVFVGGDVDPETVFGMAERYFGSIPAYGKKRIRVPKLRITHGGEVRLYGQGRGRSSVTLRYRVAPGGHPEELALDLLAMSLGDTEGKLYKELVEKKKVATSVSAHYDARTYAGILVLRAQLGPEGSALEAETAMLEAVERAKAQVPDAKAMARLRRGYRADVLGSVKNEMRLGFLLLSREMLGSWRDIDKMLKKSQTMGGEKIRAAARAYLTRDNCVVCVYGKKAPPADAVPHRPKTPPVPAATGLPETWKDIPFRESSFTLPSGRAARKILSNGLRVFLTTSKGSPVFRISATVLGGACQDPTDRIGCTSLAASVLAQAGIDGLSGQALREHLQNMVAEFSAEGGQNSHRLTLEFFPADQKEALRLFKAMLTDPKVESEALKRIRPTMLANILDREARAGSVARHLFNTLVWGDVAANRRSTQETIKAITLDDIRSLLQSRTLPDRVILSVSGDFDADSMLQTLEATFGSWRPAKGSPYRLPTVRNEPAALRPGLHLRAMASSQGVVYVGLPTVRRDHEDAVALKAASVILSRRVFNTIRSLHGLSYAASASLQYSWQYDSRFVVFFQTKCPTVPFGIRLALAEIKKMIEGGPTDAEMAEMKKTLGAALRTQFGRASSAADAFAGLEARGADLEYYRAWRKTLSALNAAAVQGAAKRHLRRDRLVILCVGDLGKMTAGDGVHPDRLNDFGTPTVHEGGAAPAVDTPRALVRALMTAVKAGDVEGILEKASKKLRKLFADNPNLQAQIKGQAAMLASAKFTIAKVDEKPETAKVTVNVEVDMGGSPMKVKMLFALVREDGAWKCDGFRMAR
jgi:predicted Zn-dependent peptidase